MSFSNVAIKDNRLYTIGKNYGDNIVYCLNAEIGEEMWQYAFEDIDDPYSTPTIDGNSIYILGRHGIMTCLKAKSGKVQWEKDLVSEFNVVKPYYGFSGSPVIEGGLVILTANTSGIALNKKTGEMVWESAPPPPSSEIQAKSAGFTKGTDFATPVLYDYEGKQYAVLSSYKGIHAVDVETGVVLWLYEWDFYSGDHAADPLVFDNKVFITRSSGLGCVLLDIAGGKPRVLWENKNMSSDISSPVLFDGYIYGCEGGPNVGNISILRCLDVETGEIMWEEDMERVPIYLTSADGKLIILKADGTLSIVEANPESYQEISSGDVLEGEETLRRFWTPPVLCNGKIYCRNWLGDLVCIDVSK